ncbi:MAG: carbohydrate kinase family protein [Planctomycetaceae bacterium]
MHDHQQSRTQIEELKGPRREISRTGCVVAEEVGCTLHCGPLHSSLQVSGETVRHRCNFDAGSNGFSVGGLRLQQPKSQNADVPQVGAPLHRSSTHSDSGGAQRRDVLCAGLIVADHVCKPIPLMPPPGGITMTECLTLTLGGSASNVAVDMAKLGLSVGIAGRIGNDPFGLFVRQEMEQMGIDCQTIQVSETADTSATLVVNVVGEDRRFIHAVGANAEFTADEVDRDLLKQYRVLYVGGFGLNPALSGDSVSALFRDAKELGLVTVLDVVVGDPGRMPEMLAPVLPFTDYFFPNEDEARMITGLGDPVAQAEQFRTAGARTVVITSGGRGMVAMDDAGLLRRSAYHVQELDATGGGDAFVAGYVYAMLQDQDRVHRLAYGAAMGASCVRSMGATTGVFNRQELETYVNTQPAPTAPAG